MQAAALASLNEDAPWTWAQRDILGLLSARQSRYVEMLPHVFRVKTAAGRVLPYHLQPYQLWFHAHSPLALGPSAPDRLVPKGRGLGLTLMTAMDLLLLAHRSNRVHIPVAGRQAETGDEFVQKCHDLAQDTVVPGFFDVDPNITSMVRLGNGSTIEPIPGGNPSSIRSRRAPAAALDEYAFHPQARRIWPAARGVLSEGGQLTVLSTHDGADTHFYELDEQTREGTLAFKRFYFPICDPEAFDPARPLSAQLAPQGPLRLIAPWLDVATLDKLQAEDPLGFRQENLCEVMDEALSLIPVKAAAAAHDPDLDSWEVPVQPDLISGLDLTALAQVAPFGMPRITLPARPYGNTNPVYVGVDFASEGDLAAFTALEADGRRLLQRWLLVLRGVKTPVQNLLLRAVDRILHPTGVLIDMTGGGTGLTEYAHEELDAPVEGVKFSQSVEVPGADAKVPIKKPMALNLALGIVDGRIRLLGRHPLAALQKRHLSAVRRVDLDAPRSSREGHADIFFADALAAWGARVGLGRRLRSWT